MPLSPGRRNNVVNQTCLIQSDSAEQSTSKSQRSLGPSAALVASREAFASTHFTCWITNCIALSLSQRVNKQLLLHHLSQSNASH